MLNLKNRQSPGFVLPSVVILSLLVLTVAAVWYRQVTVQSHLAKRVLEHRAVMSECRSLLPYLKTKLDALSPEELEQEESNFLIIKDESIIRWKIDRSAWNNNQVKFFFNSLTSDIETDSISFMISYHLN